MGLFTKRTPALGPKIVIVFHIVAYGLFQFVLGERTGIHFLHLYAILFVVEVVIMLVIGKYWPRQENWTFHRKELVELTPWRFAIPCAVTLLSCVVALYLLFSPVGLVDGLRGAFWPLLGLLALGNLIVWWLRPSVSAGALLPRESRAS